MAGRPLDASVLSKEGVGRKARTRVSYEEELDQVVILPVAGSLPCCHRARWREEPPPHHKGEPSSSRSSSWTARRLIDIVTDKSLELREEALSTTPPHAQRATGRDKEAPPPNAREAHLGRMQAGAADEEEFDALPVVPLGDKKLRACLVTGLVKTEDQVRADRGTPRAHCAPPMEVDARHPPRAVFPRGQRQCAVLGHGRRSRHGARVHLGQL